jgi:hypothetical protein
MTTIVISQPGEPHQRRRGDVRLAVSILMMVWLLLVVSFGAAGAFGVAAPLALFFAWLRLSQSFREFVLSLDLRLVAGIQARRWAGFGFLSLYAYKVLPAVFALPAGLGDMAIGLTAPWMILALVRQPGFAARGAFIRWNVLGIVDLLIAVTIGTLSTLFATGAPGEISTAPMAMLPLLLIPAFLVPLFLMLHTVALMQSWQLMRNGVRA